MPTTTDWSTDPLWPLGPDVAAPAREAVAAALYWTGLTEVDRSGVPWASSLDTLATTHAWPSMEVAVPFAPAGAPPYVEQDVLLARAGEAVATGSMVVRHALASFSAPVLWTVLVSTVREVDDVFLEAAMRHPEVLPGLAANPALNAVGRERLGAWAAAQLAGVSTIAMARGELVFRTLVAQGWAPLPELVVALEGALRGTMPPAAVDGRDPAFRRAARMHSLAMLLTLGATALSPRRLLGVYQANAASGGALQFRQRFLEHPSASPALCGAMLDDHPGDPELWEAVACSASAGQSALLRRRLAQSPYPRVIAALAGRASAQEVRPLLRHLSDCAPHLAAEVLRGLRPVCLRALQPEDLAPLLHASRFDIRQAALGALGHAAPIGGPRD